MPIEADAVEALYDQHWEEDEYKFGKASNDTNEYTTGRLGRHNVVLAHMPGVGKACAASVAASLRSSFPRIQLALVVGLCGAVPYKGDGEEIILGDVVISEGAVEYDLGRRFPDSFLMKNTTPDTLGRPSMAFRSKIAKLKSRRKRQTLQDRTRHHYNSIVNTLEVRYPGIAEDQLFQSTYRHKHQDPAKCRECGNCSGKDDPVCSKSRKLNCRDLNCDKDQSISRKRHAEPMKANKLGVPDVMVHFGVIASADTVLKSAEYRDMIFAEYDVIAFEMEVAGIWDNLPCVVVKGVCDYADSHKSKDWQQYAAANAACCMKALLEIWVIEEDLAPSETHPFGLGYRSASGVGGPQEGSLKPAFLLPFDRDEDFIGRGDMLYEIDRALVEGQRRVALSGIGGVGKSQIAIEYCYRHKAKYPNAHIFWVYAGSRYRFQQAYLEVAHYVGIDKSKASVAEVMKSVSRRLEDNNIGPWLMVVDNADNEDLLFEEEGSSPEKTVSELYNSAIVQYLPRSSRGAFLMTTRNERVGRNFCGNSRQVLRVQPFNLRDAVVLLRKKRDDDTDPSEAHMIELVNLLACLPLALSQAAAYMNQEGTSTVDYLAMLRDCTATREVLKLNHYDSRRELGIPNAIFLTWQLSFQEVLSKKPRAAEMLSQMAFLDRKSIPAELVRMEEDSQVGFDTAMGILKAYYFVNEERYKRVYTLHPLIQECTQAWVETQQNTIEWQQKALQAVVRECPLEVDFEQWAIWEVIKPHAELVLGYSATSTTWTLQRGSILTSLASYDRKRGHLDASFGKAKEAIELFEHHLGEDHPKTLEAREVLMLFFRSRRDFQKAEEVGRKLVQTREDVLGKANPQTLTAMSHLVNILASQKKIDESEKLSKEVVARTEQSDGHNHPNTLCVMNDLSAILSKNGKNGAAEEISKEILYLLRGLLGRDHPQRLRALDNLGNALMNQQKHEEAEMVLREASQLDEDYLGKGHQTTLSVKNSLAIILECRGKSQEARQVLEEVLEQRKQIFGKNHPSTHRAATNLASIRARSM